MNSSAGVAQLAGGTGLKIPTVWVRIPPPAPTAPSRHRRHRPLDRAEGLLMPRYDLGPTIASMRSTASRRATETL
jgi:hypothetical protein